MRPRKIKNSTIVVVDPTSGVGTATALSLAAMGARLVIVARTAADVAADISKAEEDAPTVLADAEKAKEEAENAEEEIENLL